MTCELAEVQYESIRMLEVARQAVMVGFRMKCIYCSVGEHVCSESIKETVQAWSWVLTDV